MIIPLVPDTHPLLKSPLPAWDFNDPPTDPIALAEQLVQNMRHHKGIGISANQLGLPYRVFAMEATPAYVCYNPKIVDVSEEQVLLEEGCLTYRGIYVKIRRPKHVKVRFTMPNGETVTHKYTGITARCFLHEYDHMEGINFLSRANQFERERAFKRLKKNQRMMKTLQTNGV